jgi:hypothetical protein
MGLARGSRIAVLLQKEPVKRRTRARQKGVTNGRGLVTARVFSVL